MSLREDLIQIRDELRIVARDKNIQLNDLMNVSTIPYKVTPMEERYYLPVVGRYVIVPAKSERLNARRRESKHETVLHQS